MKQITDHLSSMANKCEKMYNSSTYVLCQCKHGKVALVTSYVDLKWQRARWGAYVHRSRWEWLVGGFAITVSSKLCLCLVVHLSHYTQVNEGIISLLHRWVSKGKFKNPNTRNQLSNRFWPAWPPHSWYSESQPAWSCKSRQPYKPQLVPCHT